MKIKRIENVLDGTGVVSQPTCEPMSHEEYLSKIMGHLDDARQAEDYMAAAAYAEIVSQIMRA